MGKWIAIFLDAYDRFLADDGWAIASHIALSTLTLLFPFLIFATALGGFFGSKELADQAAEILLESWPQGVARPIAAEIHNVLTQSRGGLLTIGVVLALYFSSSGIEALRVGLNRAYGEKEERSWYVLRAESLCYVLVGALALLALALLVVLAPLAFVAIAELAPGLAPLWEGLALARFGVTTLALLAALVIAHKWLPAGRRSFRQIWPGVIFTLALSFVFAFAFGHYLEQFARNYVTTYAGLASVMIALLFLYALASIFVYGGELNAAILRAQTAKAD
jgi:membrane protein